MTDHPSEQPADQLLEVIDFHATTNRKGTNPPTLLLIIDVQHSETGIAWRQQLSITGDKWVALMQIPYLLWVSFATVLQFTITYLNQ